MRPPSLHAHEFQRILLIKPSALGDIVHALPVLNGLRVRYPQSRISWLVNRAHAPLIAEHPQLDEVIPFDRQTLGSLRSIARIPKAGLDLLTALRGRNFDLALDLQGLFRTGLMALASRARVRLGFRPAREGAGIFYNHGIPVRSGDQHAVMRNYAVAEVLGFADVPVTFQVPVSESARLSLNKLLSENGIPPTQPLVVVVPGSRWETKNWPAPRFAECAASLGDQCEARLVVTGGPAERDLCERVAAACPPPGAVNLAGRTNLSELIALVDRADLVLCNDSGPMHIAAALQTPAVAVFGPTNPKRTGPYGDGTRVLRTDLPCSPCYLRRLEQCPHDHECMRSVSVEAVLEACLRCKS
jgi:lipopolysaccharide heptosyltransferase I